MALKKREFTPESGSVDTYGIVADDIINETTLLWDISHFINNINYWCVFAIHSILGLSRLTLRECFHWTYSRLAILVSTYAVSSTLAVRSITVSSDNELDAYLIGMPRGSTT